MAQYIEKSALVVEIKRILRAFENSNEPVDRLRASTLIALLSFIDTLEVKEVDLNKYINKYFKGWYVDLTNQGNILHTPDGNAGLMSVKEVAKHFFELGLKAKRE